MKDVIKEKEEQAKAAAAEDEDEEKIKTIDEVSETESPTSSDSEGDDKSQFIACALNIEELYIELLYVIIHNVGHCNVSFEIGETALFSYIQDAFKISNEKHQELYDVASKKEPPNMLLNVEVIEAKDLAPKDPNGLADPYVTLYLDSSTSRRYNSSVKQTTLNPTWEEHFALPIDENAADDTLHIEVWDFDPAETVGEKFGKFVNVKGVKGIRRLVKEIAVTATTGQHNNELIGRAQIPLSAIPATGMKMWYSLDKKNKVTRQGVIKLRLGFSSEKNSKVATQEHRHLLRILLLHELETSKVAPYWWCGTFSPQAESLITQHVAQSGLCPVDTALSQWIVYTNIHKTHPLSYDLFASILEKLVKPVQTGLLSEEDQKLFWNATHRLLPSCYAMIRKIRKTNFKEKNALKQISRVLSILGTICVLDSSENIHKDLVEAIRKGAKDWFDHLLENNTVEDDSDDAKLKCLVKIVQLVRTDLQKAVEYYDKMFQEQVNFQYARNLYNIYQKKLTELVKPDVEEICTTMAKMPHIGYQNYSQVDTSQPLTIGTTLFELYLYLQRFVVLGDGLCPFEYDSFEIKDFHVWFYSGVAQWLNIAFYKALQRIDKAVGLDQLIPVDNTVKYSSSAIDSISIFYQIKIFWRELNWPDVEGCYTFIAKIIDDICRCLVHYATQMAKAVEGMGDKQDMYEKKFEVTQEWCLAINNIDYVLQSLVPFTVELGMEDILEKLSELNSPLEAQRCQQTLETVIANSVDTVKNEIFNLLDVVASKMCPSMKRLLVEGAELFHQDCNSVDRVMMYLDNNLHTLHDQLNEENFNRILDIIWDYLNDILLDLIKTNLEKRRPPSFFANLLETLKLMKSSFRLNSNCECDKLKKTERLLYLNGLETPDLIHQVHLDLWKEQKSTEEPSFGQLTVKMKFQGDELKVEILNAKNLVPMDSNGSSDSFVRVHLLPEEMFTNISKPKTQTQHKTLFPLFDESFTLKLSPEQRNRPDGLVLFSCKDYDMLDYDMLGYNNQYIGEALVHFKDVPNGSGSVSSLPQMSLELRRPQTLGMHTFKDVPNGSGSVSSLPQMSLELRRPQTLETDALKALEFRQGDKQAKEFLRRYKMKMAITKS
ncbi:C2 domain [Popillia japonica]|uniref:C2 domain n=1 Tax=Popillia japonica TaxID=7064 RepID=A0AAW1IVP4_POPJA